MVIVATVTAFVAVALSAATPTSIIPEARAAGGNGLLVPGYGWDPGWDQIIKAKQDNPGTPIEAIINPNGGPGDSKDSHWSDVTNQLQGAGIKVLGYVDTHYAGDSTSSIEQQMNDYYNWYGVDGIFLDEVSTDGLSYYTTLWNYGNGHGLVVLNPGTSVPSSYGDIANTIVVWENSYMPSHVDSNGIPKDQLAVLSHGGDPSQSEFLQIANEVKYVYGASDWSQVASNIDDQASWAAGSGGSSSTPSNTNTTPTTHHNNANGNTNTTPTTHQNTTPHKSTPNGNTPKNAPNTNQLSGNILGRLHTRGL